MMNAVHPLSSMNRPDPLPFEPFQDAVSAVDRLIEIYARNTAFLRAAFRDVLKGATNGRERARAYYPAIRIVVETYDPIDTRLSYGHVAEPGIYQTTITQPALFRDYLIEQVGQLLQNHRVAVEVGESDSPIPLHFAFPEGAYVEGEHLEALKRPLRDLFDVPDLAVTDDAIVNGSWRGKEGEPKPLAPFTAQRVDYSLHRLQHYTSTAPAHFQNFVLFTNYQFYVDEFCARARALMASGNEDYDMLVEPGNRITRRGESGPGDEDQAIRLPQMPAYHLVRGDHSGITLVNIGVGPSNAKTITDHIAVLRPHAWMMLGHCAGLRNSQQLGDYVLAHAYVREDHVLDEDLPLWVPIPALAEIQLALQQAVADVTQISGADLKRVMRTGTVASTDNRNWELLPDNMPQRRFSQSRAVALDMESATIAANGFRFRVPYGTLLCVSDKPLHGEIKLPGMANHFYRERVDQHLRIGMRAIEILRNGGVDRLHSRKLRSFAEVAFQ